MFSGFDIHPTKKQRRQTTDYDNNYTFNHTYELENECNLNTTDYAGSVGSPPTFVVSELLVGLSFGYKLYVIRTYNVELIKLFS